MSDPKILSLREHYRRRREFLKAWAIQFNGRVPKCDIDRAVTRCEGYKAAIIYMEPIGMREAL
jgi:hypothetical protein